MQSEKQVTWGGRFREAPAEGMTAFGESVSFDQVLAPFDIAGSIAHARMLARIGILSEVDLDAIVRGLRELEAEIDAGDFAWKPELEDVHMNIEQALTERVPAAARLHTGRSRNDQIATDMRLYLREAVHQLRGRVRCVAAALTDLAGLNREVLLPGYTHLQRAQPVSAAHYFLAYVEMLRRDDGRFAAAGERLNECPLGSGALSGSTLPLDREAVALELGFVDGTGAPRVTRNSLDAVSARDHFIEFLAACSTCGFHLSRLAEDMINWNSAEFGFVSLPEAYTTGSSLMPQKKNPDAFELIRGKSARLQGNLVTMGTLLKAQPLAYNRDLQEDKIPVFDSFRTLAACLDILASLLPGITFREERCRAAVSDPLLLATDLADELVRTGIPFREAHHQVGALVALAEEEGLPLDRLSDEQVGSVAPGLGTGWRQVLSLERAFKNRTGTGMPGTDRVAEAIEEAHAWVGSRP